MRISPTVGIHPVVFHQVLDLVDASGWQVRQEDPQLRVLVAGPGPGSTRTLPSATYGPP
jgi:hypothetical protein